MNTFVIQHDPDGRGWTHDGLGLGSFDARDEVFLNVGRLLGKGGEVRGNYRIVEHDGRSAGWVIATWKKGVRS